MLIFILIFALFAVICHRAYRDVKERERREALRGTPHSHAWGCEVTNERA